METTPKNEAVGLDWTSTSTWGAIGRTHRAKVTFANGDRWSFVVDQPYKGVWTVRGWRAGPDTTGSGDMVFYREASTMKAAKAAARAQANLAATQTCDECRTVAGHSTGCPGIRTETPGGAA